MNTIKKESKIPYYHQLYNLILNMINEGVLEEDDKLPSERELCERYNISRYTVRQAMRELEDKGYVYTVHGKGTYVAKEKLEQELLNFYSFTEEMKKLGKTPSSKVLNFQIINPEEKIAKKLKISAMDKVYVFTRLRLADNEPMMLETTYLPFNRFDSLTKEQLEEKAMYDIFTEEYKVKFTKARESFQPVLIREAEAYILECPMNIASMKIERTTYEGESVVEYTKSIARGDKFQYSVILER